MATSPAAGARASKHDRGLWIVTAAAAVVLVLGFVLHAALSGQKSIEQQIGEEVFAGSGNRCFVTVSTNEQVARHWPQAFKAEIIVCETSENDPHPNFIMDYARFSSAAELSATLKTAPPTGDYCTIGSAVVTRDDLRDAFAAMCSNRGGTLHKGAAE